MAFLQVALLALGTLFSVIMRFSSLPILMEDLKEQRPMSNVLQGLLGSHIAHLLWIVYSVQIWDADFAIPNIILGVLTLGFAAFVLAISRNHPGASFRYAIAVPLVMLVVWRAFPVLLTGVCAAVLQQFEARSAWDRITLQLKTHESSPIDVMLGFLGTLKCLAWVGLGALKSDYCIMGTFAVSLMVHGSSFVMSKLYARQPKPAKKA